MKRVPIPWSGRALVIGCHPEPAEPRGRWAGGAAERGEGPRDLQPEIWFSDDERTVIASFEREKRREEWMLSRIAAKQLAVERGICADPRGCTIVDRRIGRWHVSLSHSGPYAGAAIDDAPVGIDVQVVRELREGAAHLFLSDEEADAMRTCTLPHRLLHFFCAKEAEWKRRGGAITTLKRVPLRLSEAHETGLRFDGVETVLVDDLIVALTT